MLYDIVERKSLPKQTIWYTRQLQNYVDSIFHQFAYTEKLAFAVKLLAWKQSWIELEFAHKLLIYLKVGFQKLLNKNLNAFFLKSLNLISKDLMNLDFFILKLTK